MGFESAAIAGASWLWEKYGKLLADVALGEVKNKWMEFHWADAEERYRARLQKQHSTTRLLGNPKPIPIEGIYTDVYVLDKLTAFRRYDLSDLQTKSLERDALRLEEQRKPAIRIVLKEMRLFILGKPGAGKTTLLKYLTLLACAGKISKTPILIWLKEWSDSGLDLMSFIIRQFEICAFPDAKSFILHLLNTGNALVLFDGLDEVNQEGAQRDKTILTLTNFAKQYPDVQVCVTCRTASTDYSLDQFSYLEIADFDDRQIRLFAGKWYQAEPAKYKHFLLEMDKPDNKGLRELAQTPLLLALLCLAFDETLYFPSRRVDLYRESLDALLKKWDSSRGIKRDEIYKALSPRRKEQMLARIAAENFESGTYFVRKEVIVGQIATYIRQLPSSSADDDPDGEGILKAIESQHGVLVERARGIYSFSHLTFQEYFTARYVVDNSANGTLDRLVRLHIWDDRWREVFLLTASLLDDASAFLDRIVKSANGSIREDKTITMFLFKLDDLVMVNERVDCRYRAFALLFMLVSSFTGAYEAFLVLFHPELGLITGKERSAQSLDAGITEFYKYVWRSCDIQSVVESVIETYILALNISRPFIEDFDDVVSSLRIDIQNGKYPRWPIWADYHVWRLLSYLKINNLLLECMRLAVVPDRERIKNQILRPPS